MIATVQSVTVSGFCRSDEKMNLCHMSFCHSKSGFSFRAGNVGSASCQRPRLYIRSVETDIFNSVQILKGVIMTHGINHVLIRLACIFVMLHSIVGKVHHKYCIVGAGPSGLQLGYFFQQQGRDYMIFEKGNEPGTFFKTYPRHDILISINKQYTGLKNTEFNLRHDWNSLISHDPTLKFYAFTKDLFPHKKYLVQYLAEYQRRMKIKVQFNTTISNIQAVESGFTMEDQAKQQYACSVLVMATGIAKPYSPHFSGVEHTIGYEDMSLDPEDYAGKTVLIIGKGNTAFETAAHIYGRTNFIHMISRERLRLAWATHYVGDLRAVNNAVLDTYQLKSLDGLFESDMKDTYLHKMPTGKMALLSNPREAVNARAKSQGYFYDVVIRCTGWQFDFDPFNETSIKCSRGRGRKTKYPRITADYQSRDVKHLYVAGTAAHSLDYRKSAGGFIHGFRYTARTLFRILEARYEKRPWTSETYPITTLVDRFTRRANEASGTYQMYSNLGDIAIISRDLSTYQFVEEFPIRELPRLGELTRLKVEGPVVVFAFEYGHNFSGPGKDPFREDRAESNVPTAYESNFLHPVYYHYNKLPTYRDFTAAILTDRENILPKPDRLHHTIEDFFTDFRDRRNHVLPFQRYLEHVTDQDLASYSAEKCLTLALTATDLPHGCKIRPMNSIVSTDFQTSQW